MADMRDAADIAAFTRTYEAGVPQVLSETLVADLDTPVSAYLKLARDEKYSCLLESVEGGDTRGRYSIIGLRPDIVWRSNGDKVEICRTAVETPDTFTPIDAKPLESLRTLLSESGIDLPHPLPPMAAGIVGYMGYDMVRQMEDIGPGKPDPLGVNTSVFIRPTIMAIFDSVTNLITLVTPVRPSETVTAGEAYKAAEDLIETMLARLDAPLPHTVAEGAHVEFAEPISNTSRPDYYKMIAKAQDYILAGDIFQVVLSQRFSMPFGLPPFALYRALRRTNPSPFMYHLAFDDLAIVGSSPEILVRLRDEQVTIRPIAGTRKRGATPEEDADLAADLLSDEKELAEHLMLLDLGRNDVGRVSRPGTVQVTARNTIEYYSHVMHIVSNVIGEIAEGADAIDALSAGFPAGTVSGAPKVRAMEIIDELEVDARGAYAGSVGYFSANGSMDSAIVLRTAIVKDGVMHVQAGAGVVADSKPESEYQECENKARALVSAAKEALRFARSNRG